MSEQKDPYKVLGVPQGSSDAEIKKAYRKLAREHHPDRSGDDSRFKEVNAAYDVLGDSKKRADYDEFGAQSTRPGFDAARARSFGRGGMGGGFSADGGIDIEELMRMMAGGMGGGFGGRRGRGPQRGQDLQAKLRVSLREALEGSERSFDLGSRGTIRVRIPKGVRSGKRLRVPKKGGMGAGGGPPGDLVLEVTVEEHPMVRIDRDDLEMDLPITFVESIRGGAIEVQTPTGTVRVKLPSCAESGTRLRLRGRGLPKGGKGSTAGDLYLVLRPTPPAKAGRKLKAALSSLEDSYKEDVRVGLDFGEDDL